MITASSSDASTKPHGFYCDLSLKKRGSRRSRWSSSGFFFVMIKFGSLPYGSILKKKKEKKKETIFIVLLLIQFINS
jgi:hypothetical protein